MINLQNMTADDAYITRLREIQSQLQLLDRKLEAHSQRSQDCKNWAQVGDLTQLLANLEQANAEL